MHVINNNAYLSYIVILRWNVEKHVNILYNSVIVYSQFCSDRECMAHIIVDFFILYLLSEQSCELNFPERRKRNHSQSRCRFLSICLYKATYKRTQRCWPTTPKIVRCPWCCVRLGTLLHVVAYRWELLRKVWNRSNFLANNWHGKPSIFWEWNS